MPPPDVDFPPASHIEFSRPREDSSWIYCASSMVQTPVT